MPFWRDSWLACPGPSASVLVGPGDDAAVLAPGRNERLVVTTDAVVEGVHFSRAYSTPADIGHKALAVNLSDLAAMAATPRWALLSLVLPGSWLVADVEDLVDGLAALAGRHGVSVVGGNITRTDGPLVVDVTAGGEVGPRRWLTRSGALAGHEIYVSGTIGGAAAGLEMLRRQRIRDRGSGIRDRACVASIDGRSRECDWASRWAGRARRAAAMDLSDGLADALRQVAAASGVGVRIDGEALPIDPGAREWWTSRGVDPVSAAVSGGDDYELLFAVPPKSGGALRSVARHVADPPLTKIGVFTKDPRELVIARAGSKRTRYRKGSNTLRIAESLLEESDRDVICRHGIRVCCTRSRRATRRSEASVPTVTETTVLPQAGARLQFSATAYCKGETTASGVGVRTGIAAADPAILPVGSVVRARDAEPPLQRRLDGDGYGPGRARTHASTCICGAARRRCSSAGGRCG